MTADTAGSGKASAPPHLITDNDQLRRRLHVLGPGDVFCGRLRLRASEEHLVSLLLSRGVTLFPSGISQLLSRSKVLQATVFGPEMVPGTAAVHDLHDLLELLPEYQRQGVCRVVTKKDRANAGLGINLWSSLEEVFNQASLGGLAVPFVVQPYVENSRDIRVVVLGDYREAYWRDNPDNFRNNLHFGGKSSPGELTAVQWEFCREIMRRGDFPYAHLDLMVTDSGQTYLAEINLRGGIRGAVISPGDYQRRVAVIHQQFLTELGF